MENIEEHCEDNSSDGESTPLMMAIGRPKKSSARPSPLSTSTSAATTNNAAATSASTSSAPVKKETHNTFAKFSANFGNSSAFAGVDSKSESDSSDVTSFPSMNSGSTTTSPSSPPTRMPHLHKLEKKHSSGDLHSRLKTRKLLGVGETDDGDIHRSKLSQILGHSDQLYIRLPYGLRIWQLIMALMFTLIGLWALILPSHVFQTSSDTSGGDAITLPARLYGGALISLSIVYWFTLSTQDRDIIRMCLLTSIVYFAIQFIVTAGYFIFSPQPLTRNVVILTACRGVFVLISWFYHWALLQRKFFSSMKRSASCKDLSKEK